MLLLYRRLRPTTDVGKISQVGNRNSSAAKRARTSGKDDWTCPSCGNVNFSSGTTCNRRNCTQPRPADHNSKSTVKPAQPPRGASPYIAPIFPTSMFISNASPPRGFPSPSSYMDSRVPSSMYMNVPPYSSPIPPQHDVPFLRGSMYPYYSPPPSITGPVPCPLGVRAGPIGFQSTSPDVPKFYGMDKSYFSTQSGTNWARLRAVIHGVDAGDGHHQGK
ncbi:ranBP2-type zinc finger protein At1g67325-like [Punica granatum]|uniref:RanBP2-type zinc finger protein At1g67325-like n=1 Tax=Punica granatum TaxID=22663 RepID=A0A6P8EKI4_PUNGR|nr:ranBP2-type zinc finger protein At1g67325-like [Punica granatum]